MRADIDQVSGNVYGFGDFRVDTAKRLLLQGDGETVPLMPNAFDTLVYLVENTGRVIEKDELMSAIWPDTIVEENNLTQNISILRRILGEKHGENRFIATVPGHGYKFVAEVRTFDIPRPELSATRFSDLDQEPLGAEIRGQEPILAARSTRFWLITLAVISVLGLSSLGFYLWRGTTLAADDKLRTIAVLPFKPMVAEGRDEALEMGMTDSLINKISSSGNILVRPLSSVRRYNSLEQDSLLAGRELGVDSVLEGSILTSGDRIRVSARLIRTGDGRQLWTGQFDEKFNDIFGVQDSISERVLTALTLKLSGDERRRLAKNYTENVEAYQLYMKGSLHASKVVLPESQKGVEYYQQAIALDPNYALAYVGLANAYRAFSLSGDIPTSETMPRAKAAALRALELDDTLADSQVAVGLIAFWYDWNWSEAEKRYQRALELDPNDPSALFFYAHLASNLGRHEEAMVMGKRARELDPLSPITNSVEGQFLFYAGRTDEAVSRLKNTLELYPNFWHTHLILSQIYSEKAMYDEAVAEADNAAKISGGNSTAIAAKARALARSGKQPEARAVLAELQKLSMTHYVSPYNFATVYNALGETDDALDSLEKGFAEKAVLMVFLKVSPEWNNLRSQPRFIELMKKMNLS